MPQNSGQILKHILVKNEMEIELKEHEHVWRKKAQLISPLFLFLSILLPSKPKQVPLYSL